MEGRMMEISNGLRVQDRDTKRRGPRIVAGVLGDMVYMALESNKWSVDLCPVDRFWDRFEVAEPAESITI